MTDLVQRAAQFATNAHQGQTRKGNGKPYITHPARVANCAERMGFPEEAIAAAWLHDVIEDCGVSYMTLYAEFGRETADLVRELTNPSKQHPKLSRAEKKKMDREHISRCSATAQAIKAIDRIDNLNETAGLDPNWIRSYCSESRALAHQLGRCDVEFRDQLHNKIDEVLNGLPAPDPDKDLEQVDTLRQLSEAHAKINRLEACLGFFASSIKCGDEWDERHAVSYDEATK